MTPDGLASVASYLLGIKSERLDGGDTDFSKLFALNDDVEDAGLVILAIDTGVEGSYDLASDYLKFLCRMSKVSSVVTYFPQMRVRAASDASLNGDFESFSTACENMEKSKNVPLEFIKYLETVYYQNTRLNPDAKMPVYGIRGYTSYKNIVGELSTDLFSISGGLTGDHVEVVNASSAEEYVELIRKHESALSQIMGDKFAVYFETLEAVENGTVETEFAFRNLVKYAPAGEKTVFALLPRYLLEGDSDFVERAEEVYGKVAVTDTVYYNCKTYEDGEEKELNDGKYPGIFDGIRIADAYDFKGFRDYYLKVSGGDGKKIGQMGERTFFIICGSGAITFDEPDKQVPIGTVAVAPGA